MTSILDAFRRKVKDKRDSLTLDSGDSSGQSDPETSKTVVLDVTIFPDGRCRALKDGVKACRAHALRGKVYCRAHDPESRQERIAASAKGGHRKKGYRKRQEDIAKLESDIEAIRADTLRLEAMKRDDPGAFKEWQRSIFARPNDNVVIPNPQEPTQPDFLKPGPTETWWRRGARFPKPIDVQELKERLAARDAESASTATVPLPAPENAPAPTPAPAGTSLANLGRGFLGLPNADPETDSEVCPNCWGRAAGCKACGGTGRRPAYTGYEPGYLSR